MLISLMLLPSIVIIPKTNASKTSLILPTRTVTLEAFNGTNSFFLTYLSNVPSGYDVTNKSYLGWCIDRTVEMTRSPATHQVSLYSSLNPPTSMANQSWDMVNYILNHKQGTKLDVQNAIWYFINMDGNYSAFQSETAWALINETKANGKGYTPDSTQTTAVICYPVRLFSTDTNVQISIIEVIGNAPISPSSTPSSTPSQGSMSENLSLTSLFIIAIVVIVIILASFAFLLRQKSKLKRE